MEGFATFNARYLDFEEVANFFVLNDQFEKLSKTGHSILMGPRGCGKTTLLKMLTPQSISAWNKINSTKIEVPYISLYIPSDKQWQKQLKLLKETFPIIESFSKSISMGLVNLNIQISFLDMLNDLKRIHKLDDNYEYLISKELIEVWNLESSTLSNFYSIKKEIRKRIKSINNKVNKLYNEDPISIDKFDLNLDSYCYDDYLDLIESACDAFENIIKNYEIYKSPIKWAICFDELEIAPKWLNEDLIRNKLRSSTQRFYFKLTTNPIIDVIRDIESLPAPKSDFSIIRNWNYDTNSERKWKEFSIELINSKIKNKTGLNFDLNKLFGEWDFDRVIRREIMQRFNSKDINSNSKNEWEKNTIMWHAIIQLSIIDKSFKDFLIKKKIDPLDPTPINPSMIDEIHRKIKPLIVFRFYYKNEDNIRSRKKNQLFHGLDFIFKFSDGNPRTLINLINDFFPHINSIKDDGKDAIKFRSIPLGTQASIFEQLSEKKLNDIKNYPDANTKTHSGYLNLGNLLEKIGDYFFDKQIKKDFSMDSSSTFLIDKKVSNSIVELLQLASELGAIQEISTDSNERPFKSEIESTIYRFSYSLYPKFGIPPRIGKPIRLSSILSDIYIQNNQLDLNLNDGN